MINLKLQILIILFSVSNLNSQNFRFKDGQIIGNDDMLIKSCRENMIKNNQMVGTTQQFDNYCSCFLSKLYGNITMQEMENAAKEGTMVALFGQEENYALLEQCTMDSGITVKSSTIIKGEFVPDRIKDKEIEDCVLEVKDMYLSNITTNEAKDYCSCVIDNIYGKGLSFSDIYEDSSNAKLLQEVVNPCQIELRKNSESINEIVTQEKIRIKIDRNGFNMNSLFVTPKTSLDKIFKLLGSPSKQKISNLEDINNSRQKYGSSANNRYTWDKLGIVLYQDAENSEIKSMNIVLREWNYDFAPNTLFGGDLFLEDLKVNSRTSLSELNNVPNSTLKMSPYFVHTLIYMSNKITLEYLDEKSTDKLVGFSYSFKTINRNTNTKGWTKEDILQYKSIIRNLDKIIELGQTYNIDLDLFAACYTDKIVTTYTQDEVNYPTNEVASEVSKHMEECLISSVR